MWAAACFPSTLGFHMGEHVSLCYQRATQRAWGSKEKPIYYSGDFLLYERLLSLILQAKTNNQMIHKGSEILGGIKSLSFLTPKLVKGKS